MADNYHFIGIGGIGMSGLARLLMGKKIKVSGSDICSSSVVESLIKDGADIKLGHSARHVVAGATVVYSTDIKKDNPEYETALKLQCKMMHRSELLQMIMSDYKALAVAGTHGKTTTSSLLAWVLESSGRSPSYAIGGVVPQLASNAGTGSGAYFVAEACESDGSFLNYHPFGAIVTNIDCDHMDHYGTEGNLNKAFGQFIAQVSSSEHLFWCGDDERLRALKPKGVSYGFRENCRLKGTCFRQEGWKVFFDASIDGRSYHEIEVSLTGKHNALNALAVFGLSLSLGIEENSIRQALKSFKGVHRRCEKVGEAHGVLVLDDYAHHPTELKAILKAIRSAIGARRLIAVYQPHRYSRSKDCMGQFEGVFDEADLLYVNEIYAAREQPIEGVSHLKIADEIKKGMMGRCAVEPRKTVAALLAGIVRPHDVVVTLGAGDVTQIGRELLHHLEKKAPAKLKVGVIFGGRSVEHDISLISSSNIIAALRKDLYEIEQFGIGRSGRWVHGDNAREQLSKLDDKHSDRQISHEVFSAISGCDILFPVLHGTYGEDGTIQGFFEMLSKAYVGCDFRSAAVSMDKALTKRLVMEAGVSALPFVSFSQSDWQRDKEKIAGKIEAELTFPVFVKPVHLGSTIGVHKVKERTHLEAAIASAFRFDTQIIVETGLENPREIEFSLLGNENPVVFPPGEVLTVGNVHDYDSKYGLNPNKAAAGYDTLAKLSPEKAKEGMEMALKAYLAVGGIGMARVDTFLDHDGKFWFNEINPIPGFTKYSLYPLMCAANGLPLNDLTDSLIVLGMQRRRLLDRLVCKAG